MSETTDVFDEAPITFDEGAQGYIREIAHLLGISTVTRDVVSRVLARALLDEVVIMRARANKESIFVGTNLLNAEELVWPPGQ